MKKKHVHIGNQDYLQVMLKSKPCSGGCGNVFKLRFTRINYIKFYPGKHPQFD